MSVVIDAVAFTTRNFPVTGMRGGIYKRVLEPLCNAKPRWKTAHTPAGVFECNVQDVIQRFIWLWHSWEPVQTTYIQAHLKPGDGFVDVGANMGWFTVLAGNLGADVVAFEPLPSIFEQLSANAKLNGLTPRLVRAAIMDREGEIPVYRSSDLNSGLSTTEESRGHAFEAMVPAVPLHSALTTDEVKNARIMKIDVEGASVQAAQGLMPLLSETRPDLEVLMELDISDDPAWPGMVTEMFTGAGFYPYLIENDYAPSAYAGKTHPREAPRCDPSTGKYGDVLFSRRNLDVIRW